MEEEDGQEECARHQPPQQPSSKSPAAIQLGLVLLYKDSRSQNDFGVALIPASPYFPTADRIADTKQTKTRQDQEARLSLLRSRCVRFFALIAWLVLYYLVKLIALGRGVAAFRNENITDLLRGVGEWCQSPPNHAADIPVAILITPLSGECRDLEPNNHPPVLLTLGSLDPEQ